MMVSTSLGLLLLCSFIILPHSLSVFMRKEKASQILRVQKRANSFLEEIQPGNLERECIEEQCSFEEAKEIFRSKEKTMEFWFDYKDFNPCKENKCKNGGICKIKYYEYSCTCPPRYRGNQCEIEKFECWYKNGGCWQYCQDMVYSFRVICSCALGYTLNEDGKRCTPSDRFPCGLIKRSFEKREIKQRETMTNWNQNLTNWNQENLINWHQENSTNWNQENLTNWNQENLTNWHQENSTNWHQENSTNWNRTLSQASSGETKDDMEQLKRNFTEGDLYSWLNINYTDDLDSRIIGGSFCRPGACPWQVLIQNEKGYGFCGGSLISSQWVLTAAHCLETVNPHQVTVGDFDKYQRERDEQKVGVRQYWRHPLYDSKNYNNDIALMQLTSDVVFSQNVRPICLPSPSLATLLIDEVAQGMVSGWGATHAKGRLTRFLMKVQLPIVSMETCRQSTEKLFTGNMFCAGYDTEGHDSCKGDSGGPFAVAYHNVWYLLGIVSWGEGCAEVGKYGAYTLVSNYISWIKEIIESATDSGSFLYNLQ